MKKLIGFSAQRPKALLMVWAGILILGLNAASGLAVDYLPDLTVPKLVVSAAFPGLPAGEMRTLIALPLEEALSSVKGATRISSVSREGRTTIVVDFKWGESTLAASLRASEAIDAAYPGLPEGASKPMVLPFDPAETATLVVAVRHRGGDLSAARRFAEFEAKTRFQQGAGVGSVTLVGGTEKEILVSVDPERAASRGLLSSQVADILSRENLDYPAGLVREGEMELVVRASGKAASREALGELRLRAEGGSFALREIATIGEREKPRASVFVLDGREWVGLEVTRRKGASPLDAAASVKKEVAALAEGFGRDFEIAQVLDESVALSSTIWSIVSAIALGAGIAFLVLILFTRNLASSLLLVAVMPLSIVASLAALKFTGSSVNLMLLGGFSLGIGMITDNAVVVLEQLLARFRGRERIEPLEVAGAVGEVSGAMFGSTLTTIIVFAPVILLPGALGALFTDLALALIFSILASWITAITLVPALFVLAFPFLRKARIREPGPRSPYGRGLGLAFRRPLLALLVALALSAGGFGAFSLLRIEFMPEGDSERVELRADFPPGSELESIADYAEGLSARLRAGRGILAVFGRAGGERDDHRYQASSDSRREELLLQIAFDPAVYPSSVEAKAAIQGLAENFAGKRGMAAELGYGQPSTAVERLLGFQAEGRRAALRGTNPEEARKAAESLVATLGVEGSPFAELRISPSGSRPELRIIPDREALAAKGLGFADLAGSLAAAVDGKVATSQREEGREVEVRVKDSREYGEGNLGDLIAARAEKGSLRLSSLAGVERADSAPSLARLERSDVAYVKARAKAGREAEAYALFDREAAATGKAELLEGSAFETYSASLLLMGLLVLVLLYLALGAQFESFSLPFLLLSAIPLSFAGVSLALLAAGYSINYGSALGLIVLFGVVVNNSIILWEVSAQGFASLRAKAEAERAAPLGAAALRALARQAATEGAQARLRPILMTVLTTVLSLLPLLFSRAELTQKSMAVALLGGFTVSTALTLFIAPLLFAKRLAKIKAPRGSAPRPDVALDAGSEAGR